MNYFIECYRISDKLMEWHEALTHYFSSRKAMLEGGDKANIPFKLSYYIRLLRMYFFGEISLTESEFNTLLARGDVLKDMILAW